MKSNLAYNILEGLCEVRNTQSSLKGLENPVTPRVNYILDTIFDLKLIQNGVKMNLDIFDDSIEGLKYVNVELFFDKGADSSVMFIAHHDVNNIYSDNCQDNSASVSNLLSLAEHCSTNNLGKNVHIVFTDCEEFGGRGAKRLADKINNGEFGNVEYVVNLELTANGTKFWADTQNFAHDSALEDKLNVTDKFVTVRTPFNDSVVLRGRGIDSVCIGSLTEGEMNVVLSQGYCGTWALCHKPNDTFENAVGSDMDNFVELLIKLI